MVDWIAIERFFKRKSVLIQQLNDGVIFPEQWESAIAEANRLNMSASRDQLIGYYDHYKMEDYDPSKPVTRIV